MTMLVDDDGNLLPPSMLRNTDGGYWYVGSPYSKYPDGIQAAFRDICRITGWLIGQGVPCYSPIAHTHPISLYARMDPLDHTVWLPADAPLMNAAHGLIIAEMAGWNTSFGLTHEIGVFEKAKKPIVHLVVRLN